MLFELVGMLGFLNNTLCDPGVDKWGRSHPSAYTCYKCVDEKKHTDGGVPHHNKRLTLSKAEQRWKFIFLKARSWLQNRHRSLEPSVFVTAAQ